MCHVLTFLLHYVLNNLMKLLFETLVTLNSAYNEKKYADILLRYRWLFVKGNVIIGEWDIFGVEVFLCYSQFFVKDNFIIGGVECTFGRSKLAICKGGV